MAAIRPVRVANFGMSIRALRTMNKLTQAELAARSGLSRSSITNIELGNQLLTSDTITSIAAAMGYEVRINFVKKKPPEA